MTNVMFSVPSAERVKKIIITEDCVRNGAEPTLIEEGNGSSARLELP